MIVNFVDAGSFVKPSMTFIDMKVETQMNKLKLSEKLIQDAVNILPTLTDLTFIKLISSENGKRRYKNKTTYREAQTRVARSIAK
jgi:hypothetical protein